jgi:mono/diheme cytochrome c family protein
MQLKYQYIGAFATIISLASCGNDTQTTTTNNAPQVEYGINIFRKNCVSCHGAEGNMGFNGAFDLTKSVLSADERIAVITNGRKAMTPFKQLLSEAEIKAVADYTLSLKK